MRENGVARDGFLYANEFLRPSESAANDLAFVTRVISSDHVEPSLRRAIVPFGGESRSATTSLVSVALPEAPPDFPGNRVLLYLATPGVFADGWRPPTPGGATLVCACVDGPLVVTGWDPVGGAPRPLRWGVAAGSVYLFRFPSADAAHAAARAWHGRLFPAQDLAPELVTAGFGLSLVGRWS